MLIWQGRDGKSSQMRRLFAAERSEAAPYS